MCSSASLIPFWIINLRNLSLQSRPNESGIASFEPTAMNRTILVTFPPNHCCPFSIRITTSRSWMRNKTEEHAEFVPPLLQSYFPIYPTPHPPLYHPGDAPVLSLHLSQHLYPMPVTSSRRVECYSSDSYRLIAYAMAEVLLVPLRQVYRTHMRTVSNEQEPAKWLFQLSGFSLPSSASETTRGHPNDT